MIHFLEHHQSNQPDKLALISGPHRITYKKLYELMLSMVGFLSESITGSKPMVAFCLPNGLSNILLYLACWYLGWDIMPINPRLKPAELGKIILRYEPTVLFVLPAMLDNFKKQKTHFLSMEKDFIPECSLVKIKENAENSQIVQLTSGTLGQYKGAVHDLKQLTVYASGIATAMRYQSEDCLLIALSLNHAMAFSYQFLPAICLGLTQVILPKFEAIDIVNLIKTEKITSLSLLPTMAYWVAQLLLESKKNNHLKINSIFIAGDALPKAMADVIYRAFRQYPVLGIGMTETYGYCLNFDYEHHPQSAGTCILDYQAKIGSDGELLIRGDCVMKAYYQDPALTGESFDQAWLKTGDLACIDEEQNIHYLGRRKNIIVTAGSKISPIEIEALLYEHPWVLEACVVGQFHFEYQSVPVAFVALLPEKKPDEVMLKDFLRQQLADYKIPHKIIFLAELPKNSTGKIDRDSLQKAETAHDCTH